MTAAMLILGGLIFSAALSYGAQKQGPLLLLVLCSYGLRVLLTLSFFIISAWHLPVLPELQIEGGFWQFAPDAASYHSGAAQTAEAWGRGEPLSFSGSWYLFLIALLYHVSGPSPLHAALLNAWADSLTIIFGYLLALRLAGRRAGLKAAALIAFWPSSLIWSTQLLKESFSVALIMGVLCATVWLCAAEVQAGHRKTLLLRISLWLAVGAGVRLLSGLRLYMGVILWASVLVALALAGIMSLVRRQPFPLWTLGGVLVLLSAGLLDGRFLPYQSELEQAALPYRQALGINPRDAEAWYNLGGVRLRQGWQRLPEALQAYRHYDNYVASSDGKRTLVRMAIQEIEKIMARPEAERGAAIHFLLARLSPRREGALDQEKAQRIFWKAINTVVWEVEGILQTVVRGVEGILQKFALARLNQRRIGFVSTGGHSLFDPGINLNRFTDVLSYLPRGLAHTLFAPLPWQWFDTQGSTGRFKSFATVEVISVYLLFPMALRGIVWLVRRRRSDGLVIVVFTVVTAVLLSLTIANGGTLFRLRLQCLLPLLVITSIGGSRAAHPEMGAENNFAASHSAVFIPLTLADIAPRKRSGIWGKHRFLDFATLHPGYP